jgi:hypothetical protein
MRIQALGAAIAYDVKKLARLRRPGPAAGRAALLHAVRLTDCRRRARGAHPWGKPGRRVWPHGPSRPRSAHRDATGEPGFGNGPCRAPSVSLRRRARAAAALGRRGAGAPGRRGARRRTDAFRSALGGRPAPAAVYRDSVSGAGAAARITPGSGSAP